ncbi:large ribosomal subunit protein mL38 [Denticeps clupeoides]|uniref:Large ribosomal subunit protein mL38 n=1 Tax=Denticeps clupeoides TaxID=299321 RepID=A0AAY3ZYS2_9TELE|nr:39S ribosomal protein L38, mitochondrial [Denticeps clupeoides]
MALRMALGSALRVGTDLGVNSNIRGFGSAAVLCHKAAPLGPMPNEDIDTKNLDALEKYRGYKRYLRAAWEASSKEAWWRTYSQYAEGEKAQDSFLVDIGLPYQRPSRTKEAKERRITLKENKHNAELERAMRLRTFKMPLDRVKAEWEKTNGPYHVQRLAEHYGVFRDLFPMAYFVPRVMLRVGYGQDGGVHYGNQLPASKAEVPPHVTFEAEEGSLWTLLLTSPDEHLQDNEQEYIHWLVGNIPGNAVQSGEELCHYLPPFPAKGTGFHRFVFILFKQDAIVDYKDDCRPSPCHCLNERTFKTVDFYRKHQDVLTPASLAFFQCQWDESVTSVFHNVLNMKEPVFEYDRPPVYHPPQKKYPHGQPLRYLDRYRNGQEVTYGIY